MWKGQFINNRKMTMTGRLTSANGIYTYTELLVHEDVRQNRSQEVTRATCHEIGSFPDWALLN